MLCLWDPAWESGGGVLAELAALLLEHAPRVAVEARGVIWVDVRGLPGPAVAHALLRALPAGARAGLSEVPVVAEVAARAGEGPLTVVEPGRERAWLAPHPLALLGPPERLRPLLEGVGVRCCGELAALTAEAVEVRLGGEARLLWERSRAEDRRRLFGPVPLSRPHASFEFVDYQVTDAARLVFTVNGLLGAVLGELRRRAQRSRRLVLTLTLGGGGTLRRELRATRPTAERGPWLERLRAELGEIRIPDTVRAVALESADEEGVSASQGDFFDRGFATRGAVEAAVGRLLDEMGEVFVAPRRSAHPLPEVRVRWEAAPAAEVAGRDPAERPAPETALALHLLPEPAPVAVRVRARRDHALPVAVRERRGDWQPLAEAAGPDRVSGGVDGEGFAREYFRCVTEAGRLLWVYRDARSSQWFLQGWWD